MSYLFDNELESKINKSAIELLLYSRSKALNDMSLSNGSYEIEITDVKKEENNVIVEFKENDTFNFKFMKDITSKASGITNTFTFIKKGNEYKIESIRKVQDYYIMFTNELDNIKSDKDIENLLKNYKDTIDLEFENLKKSQEEFLKEGIPSFKCDNKYDREKALQYAKKYITTRNKEWAVYDEYGGNCQNFASQVIYNGGIPMDIIGSGDEQWKHYGTEIIESNEKKGRSSSWTGVSKFYQYAKNNSGFGLCAITDANIFSGEIGDITQVGYNDSWNHTLVVVGNIKKKDLILDLLVNSNTINIENYPLQGYVYPNKRLIKIMGWNNS